jgi:hypothetical protein
MGRHDQAGISAAANEFRTESEKQLVSGMIRQIKSDRSNRSDKSDKSDGAGP